MAIAIGSPNQASDREKIKPMSAFSAPVLSSRIGKCTFFSMVTLKTETPLNTWLVVSWKEFVKLADDPAAVKLKSYYYNGRMRFEPLSTGSDHSSDHALILFAISFFAAYQLGAA